MSDEKVSRMGQMGELKDADAVGTAGSPDCGDMLRMWMKFRENERGEKVVDRATFQSFGCETAMAVAGVATEMLAGKTVEEAKTLTGGDFTEEMEALPPMKLHCASLVEEAMRQALENVGEGESEVKEGKGADHKGTLLGAVGDAGGGGKEVKIVFKPKGA